MNYPRSLSRRGQRALAERLDRLRLTLENLSDRVRSAVAEAVGQGVAGLVHDALLALLDDLASRDDGSHMSPYRTNPAAWRDAEEDDWAWGDEQSQWPEEEPDPYDLSTSTPRTRKDQSATKLPLALAAGLRAASWWLRRPSARRSWLAASGVGLLTATLAYLGGPLAAAAVGLADSALWLDALTAAARTASSLDP